MRTPFLALALSAASAFAQTPIDKTMVIVNGQPITAKTYFKRMEVLPDVGKLVNGKLVQATPGYLALSKLIDEALMVQLAKENHVAPTDAEVDAAIKERTDDNPDLLVGLQKIGFTADDLRYDTIVQLSEYKLQTMGINITDGQVDDFYKKNPEIYTLPKRYHLSVIAVDSEDKKKAVDAALNAGKKFSDVAREQSLDISKANDGEMGEVPESALQGGTQAAVKSTPKGSTTNWLSNGELFVKFWVQDVMEQKLVPLDAALKSNIRQRLMLDRGRIKNDLGKMMDDMRKRSKIEFQGTIFDEQLKTGFGKG